MGTAPGVTSVTPDGALHLLSDSYSAYSDPYSTYSVENQAGTRYLWGQNATGAGVDVGLIDSGVVPVQGLNSPGQVINGPDLTPRSQAPLDGHPRHLRPRHLHGRDHRRPRRRRNRDTSGDPTDYVGVAPDARIVSVKVADARGNDRRVAGHRRDRLGRPACPRPGMNIRVLNLSFGTDSTQSYQIDPLAYATEVAWRAGIVVVTSAGNAGLHVGRPHHAGG